MSSKIGFQWEKYEAWRYHPLLRFNKNTMFPGVGLGAAAFAVYYVVDTLSGDKSHH
uniref:B12 n=1 Tax=Polytomella sp. Pringsheim 198.80 TaxID=37502 RepID=UPI001E1E244E|nr:Chain k, B12 [Polytomella sp. Pringsheim 198.80]7ARD_k Chain k, B12 [Polytomella sp. Pringsheim 198.80]|eukprot:CAMPEP_0175073094 /NCGR_PEP_ID=MMETSP0052_2-20121109/20333_1 /TAXON_ID=51329 ORGANISM="Polytomella parva, Strain SAG 63-3" /NCGR_SAMPLE_ID=MMETSP0052_2 /ASSEMBLY_ACC=CAM_ASM_000194 /LENGTH=55 /DNA_ID=CAMNT_0016340789 /DNA_START=14 /DNA_END=181 /DNA_ORIENTATION=+